MPGGDRTGPMGQGPMTGRGAGYCAGFGMPGYAKDGAVVCFFRGADKFKERYMTLGFNDNANLDEGTMWPIAFALKELTAAEEERIAALVRKAVS